MLFLRKIKKGFGFGAIPAVSFDTDLGFQYGAIVNLYDYGDGTIYPKYNHSLYLEWSRYTKAPVSTGLCMTLKN